MEQTEIQKELSEKLSKKRYQHTLGVAFTAASLAMRYDMDMKKAYLAGLLHDCAKYMTEREQIKYCEQHRINLTPVEKSNTALLHAKIGCELSKERYGIIDTEILNAILFHTTGKPQMTDFEKIIFISDYIEPGREHDPQMKEIRYLAFQDLDQCIIMVLRNTIEYLRSLKREVDETTVLTYEYYEEKGIFNESK